MNARTNTGVIAGVVLAVVAIVALVGGAAAWVLHREAADSETGVAGPRGSGAVDVKTLEVGDCLAANEEHAGQLVETVDVVPCSKPHGSEVYAVFELPDGPWPGDEEVENLADRGCLDRFTAFVGVPYRQSRLDFTYYYPAESGWPELRKVACLVFDSVSTTGTLEGSRR